MVKEDRKRRELARVCFNVVTGYVISRRYVVGECRKKDRRGRQAGG